MKVTLSSHKGAAIMELSEALQFESPEDGLIERAQADSSQANKSIAKLVAFLVDEKKLTLEQAKDICNCWYDLEEVEG